MVTNKVGTLRDFGLPAAVRLTSPDHLADVALPYGAICAYCFEIEYWCRNVGHQPLSKAAPHCGRSETSDIINLHCQKPLTLNPYLLDAFLTNSVTVRRSTVNDPQRQALNQRQAKVRHFISYWP